MRELNSLFRLLVVTRFGKFRPVISVVQSSQYQPVTLHRVTERGHPLTSYGKTILIQPLPSSYQQMQPMNISSLKQTFHARILGISTFASYLSRNTRITLKQAFFPTLIKRAAQISFLVSHLPGHFQYLKVLSDAHRKNIIGNDQFIGQFIRYKYLGTYLIRSMKMIDRLRALTFHYSFLCKKLVKANQDSFLKDGIVIWHKKCEESADDFQIVLEPSTSFEGELALRFVMNSLTLFTLAFLIIPGRTVNLPYEKVVFIGGIQGVLGRRQEIRHAAKNNGEIDPSGLLLIAAKAIAKALGVDAIAGISSQDQAAIGYANGKLLLNYDAFWMSAGGTQIDNRFFVLTPNAEGKPLVEIPNKHRSRTKRKRLLKNEIQNDICFAFTKHFFLEGGLRSNTRNGVFQNRGVFLPEFSSGIER